VSIIYYLTKDVKELQQKSGETFHQEIWMEEVTEYLLKTISFRGWIYLPKTRSNRQDFREKLQSRE